jgi:protein-S-isoprenylcysteine O-methyltransferase Ste14
MANVAESGATVGAIGLDLAVAGQASPQAADGARATRGDLADRCARLLIIVLFTFMAVTIGSDFLKTGRLTGLLLLASEALVVLFTVLRRAPTAVDRSIRARVLTTLSLLGPPLVRPAAVGPFAPEVLTVGISVVGLLIVIAGKISLGRSFGVVPANRGIVSTGIYRMVRHPIYLGYLITHVAFLAANPTPWNIGLLVTADIALLARAVCEERTLVRDASYRSYKTRVRWRVVPGLF